MLHAVGLTLIGLQLIFKRGQPSRESDASAMLGVTTTAVGLSYLTTAYVPIEENQFLHASVPVRVLLGLLAGSKAILGGGLTADGKRNLLIVLVYDGLGGLAAGWWLGRYDGRIAGY